MFNRRSSKTYIYKGRNGHTDKHRDHETRDGI